jgi:hypothetical protein
MEFTKNILFDKILFHVDLENKQITKNYYHNSIIKIVNYFKEDKMNYLYKRDNIYNLNIISKLKINPLIQKFILYDTNNIKIESNYLLNSYLNNIPFWIISENENFKISKIQIIYFDSSIKELTDNFMNKTLFDILKK